MKAVEARWRAIVAVRCPTAVMHEFGADAYESDEQAAVRGPRTAAIRRARPVGESSDAERLAR
jgi:hypothetical protein